MMDDIPSVRVSSRSPSITSTEAEGLKDHVQSENILSRPSPQVASIDPPPVIVRFRHLKQSPLEPPQSFSPFSLQKHLLGAESPNLCFSHDTPQYASLSSPFLSDSISLPNSSSSSLSNTSSDTQRISSHIESNGIRSRNDVSSGSQIKSLDSSSIIFDSVGSVSRRDFSNSGYQEMRDQGLKYFSSENHQSVAEQVPPSRPNGSAVDDSMSQVMRDGTHVFSKDHSHDSEPNADMSQITILTPIELAMERYLLVESLASSEPSTSQTSYSILGTRFPKIPRRQTISNSGEETEPSEADILQEVSLLVSWNKISPEVLASTDFIQQEFLNAWNLEDFCGLLHASEMTQLLTILYMGTTPNSRNGSWASRLVGISTNVQNDFSPLNCVFLSRVSLPLTTTRRSDVLEKFYPMMNSCADVIPSSMVYYQPVRGEEWVSVPKTIYITRTHGFRLLVPVPTTMKNRFDTRLLCSRTSSIRASVRIFANQDTDPQRNTYGDKSVDLDCHSRFNVTWLGSSMIVSHCSDPAVPPSSADGQPLLSPFGGSWRLFPALDMFFHVPFKYVRGKMHNICFRFEISLHGEHVDVGTNDSEEDGTATDSCSFVIHISPFDMLKRIRGKNQGADGAILNSSILISSPTSSSMSYGPGRGSSISSARPYSCMSVPLSYPSAPHLSPQPSRYSDYYNRKYPRVRKRGSNYGHEYYSQTRSVPESRFSVSTYSTPYHSEGPFSWTGYLGNDPSDITRASEVGIHEYDESNFDPLVTPAPSWDPNWM